MEVEVKQKRSHTAPSFSQCHFISHGSGGILQSSGACLKYFSDFSDVRILEQCRLVATVREKLCFVLFCENVSKKSKKLQTQM